MSEYKCLMYSDLAWNVFWNLQHMHSLYFKNIALNILKFTIVQEVEGKRFWQTLFTISFFKEKVRDKSF